MLDSSLLIYLLLFNNTFTGWSEMLKWDPWGKMPPIMWSLPWTPWDDHSHVYLKKQTKKINTSFIRLRTQKQHTEVNWLISMQTTDLHAAVQSRTRMCTCILKMLITAKSVKAHSPARLIKQHHLIYIRN